MDRIKQINSIYKTTPTQKSKRADNAELPTKKKSKTSNNQKTRKLSTAELKKSISEKLQSLDKNSKNYFFRIDSSLGVWRRIHQ